MKRRVFLLMLTSAILVMLEASSVWAVKVKIKVKDSENNPVSGVKVRYGMGSTYTTWWFKGGTLTNDQGKVVDQLDPGTYSFQALYHNGHAEELNVIVAEPGPVVVTFHTYKLTLRLQQCDTSTGIAGARARYGAGSTYTTRWFPDNPATPTDADGEVVGQVFPGTYSFEMQYAGTADSKISEVIPAADTTLTWDASKVTLQYSGRISYGGSSGDARWFKNTLGGISASKYLLPGTYTFHARTGGRFDLDIDACEVTKTINLLRLRDHNGDPLAGAIARGGFGSNYVSWWVPWPSGGTTAVTDSTYGVMVDVINGLQTTMSYEMLLHNGSQQIIGRDVTIDSIFDFQTGLVTLRFEDGLGNPIDGAKISYGKGAASTTTWFPENPGLLTGTSAPGEVTGELFPGTYSFKMVSPITEIKSSVPMPGGSPLIWVSP